MTALDDIAVTPFYKAEAPQRARMLSRLSDTEMSVALKAEPEGDQIELRLFPLEAGPVALACDGEDRLADFFGTAVPYAAMPGRVLAELLCREGVGLLVNPGHPSEMLLDTELLGWLSGALSAAPVMDEARMRVTAPSADVVETLAEPLSIRLADMRGLISGAALVGIQGDDGLSSHLLLIRGAAENHQAAIAKALAETLAFLPPQPGGVDVSFADIAPPAGALHFEPSEPAAAPSRKAKAPPRLR